ncbi:MAG: hypothetical protein JWQ25_2283, partial [Daejeonella sp.]|nr:hypothetical protein [Daejeonella sp.]
MIIHFLGNETLLELTHIDVLLEGIQERITRLNNITSQVVIEELPEELVLSEHLAIISQKIAELQNDLRAVSV